jgi:transcriptional antiterminator NusG
MKMTEKAWHLVKDTPKVIGFIGNQQPREVPLGEIDSMRRGIVEGAVKPKPRLSFALGEEVRVLDGAFANFTGTVKGAPVREELNEPAINEQLVVEYYSR